jgi:hypothetical protein
MLTFREFYIHEKLNIMERKISRALSSLSAFLLFNLIALVSAAQDKGIDVDINVKKESQWYQQPWIWVAGGAVFILLLAAILRGGSTKKE